MDITKNEKLIEALLLEELPECSADSDVPFSDDENENQCDVPVSSRFDDVFEAELERVG